MTLCKLSESLWTSLKMPVPKWKIADHLVPIWDSNHQNYLKYWSKISFIFSTAINILWNGQWNQTWSTGSLLQKFFYSGGTTEIPIPALLWWTSSPLSTTWRTSLPSELGTEHITRPTIKHIHKRNNNPTKNFSFNKNNNVEQNFGIILWKTLFITRASSVHLTSFIRYLSSFSSYPCFHATSNISMI